MPEDKTVLLKRAVVKDGISKSGKPYQRTIVQWSGEDGEDKFASAFGNGLYEHAKPLEEKHAILTLETNEAGFTDLVAIRPAPEKAEPPKPGTGEYVTGQKPPIEARRIAASTAAHVAASLTQDYLGHVIGREVTPALVCEVYTHFEDYVFLSLGRRGRFLEDSEIPL